MVAKASFTRKHIFHDGTYVGTNVRLTHPPKFTENLIANPKAITVPNLEVG